MKLNVKEKTSEPLLHRTSYECSIESDTTPKRGDVKNALVANLGVEPKKLILDHISQRFGDNHYKVKAKVYDSEEYLEKIEHKHLQERNKKASEQPQEAKEEKAPSEETTEDKAEEKPAPEGEEKKEE